MLAVSDLDAGYEDVQVLRGVSLEVAAGEIVSLVGANGAGKTTTLRTISGLLRPTRGAVVFDGRRIDRSAPHAIVAAGLVHVPEGRKLFPELTVLENLQMGAILSHARRRRAETLKRVFELFPRLQERRDQRARTMSGGEQQMLALGRALMACPRLLMLDEPSLGLAPIVVEHILGVVREVSHEEGLPILIVEQHVSHALRMAHRGYVIENGAIVLQGTGEALLQNAQLREAYLGL